MDVDKMNALEALVNETDGEGPPTPEQQAAAQAAIDADSKAREWAVLPFSIGRMLVILAPELREVYTEQACLDWGTSMVPVADKYGWNGPGNVPELGLAMSTFGLAVPSFLAVRLRLEQLRAVRQAQQGRAAGAAPAAAAPAAAAAGDLAPAAALAPQAAEVQGMAEAVHGG